MGQLTIPAVVWTEAKRYAIWALKNKAREAGIKPLSAIPASKWTELALDLIQRDYSFVAKAQGHILRNSPEKLIRSDLIDYTGEMLKAISEWHPPSKTAVTSNPAKRQR